MEPSDGDLLMYRGDLGSALVAAAERFADKPALWAAGKRLTYTELFDSAARISAALQSAGVGAGDRVAILSNRTVSAYVGIVAALMSGCTCVPLNERFPRERNQIILDASDAAALIVDAALGNKLGEYLDPLRSDLVVVQAEPLDAPQVIGAETAEPVKGSGPDFWRSVHRTADAEQAAYLLFTSGTTGRPKGVPVGHRNISNYLAGISEVMPLRSDDRVLQAVDLTFDLSVHDMFLTWLNGAELYSLPKNAGELAPRLVAQHGITSVLLVPPTGSAILEKGLAKPGSMPTLRVSSFCGEALPRAMVTAWSEAAPNSRILNLYGPTEATVAVSYYEFNRAEAAEFPVLPIGRPLGKQRMALFRPDMTEAPAGEYGQICLAGSQVTVGYWRNPEMDAQKFASVNGDRWYKTGDLGRWIDPYGFVFAGRADRQVKVRGYLVELQEIEGILRRVTGRQQVAVIPWPMEHDGSAEGSVAFVCGEEADTKAWRVGCRSVAGDYMTPDRFIFVPELPVNANGKVDYKVLAQHPGLAA